jgi:hypothetical protein
MTTTGPGRTTEGGAVRATDSRGLTLSTTAAAARHYRAGVDALLRYEDGLRAAVSAALTEDPDFALGHTAQAIEAMVYGDPLAAAAAVTRARERSGVLSERERGHIAVVAARVAGDPTAIELAVEHLWHHPSDALVLYLALGALRFSGLPDIAERVDALVELVRSAYGESDWWWLGAEAFRLQERGRYDESAELSARAFALEPRGGWAAHALTHVHYETASHRDGRRWLDEWLAAETSGLAFATHLHWHAALHELADGDVTAARRRLDTAIAPPTRAPYPLVDGGSLLWRLRLRRLPPLGADALADAVPPVAHHPPSVFAALHAGLGLAAVGDVPALAALAARVRGDARPAFAEVCAPVLDALVAFVEQRYDVTVRLLTALPTPELARLGGSAAQREVVADTLVEALLRRDDPAATEVLEKRLV